MFIDNLKIKDFGNISEKELYFDRINLITGSNWAGKSKVLQAIAYLITDHLPSKKQSDLIRWYTEFFSLAAELKHKGNRYDYAVNVFHDKNTERCLIRNDKDEFFQSDALKVLQELIDPKLALYSSISEQHESTKILFELPAKRLEKLKAIFGIDILDPVVEQIGSDVKSNETRINILIAEIDTLKDRTFDYLDVPELSDITVIQNSFDKLSIEKERYEAETKLYDKYMDDLEDYDESLKKLTLIVSKLKNKQETLSELKPRDNIDFGQVKFDELVDQINCLKIKQAEYDSKLESFNNYQHTLEKIDYKINSINESLSKINGIRREPICDVKEEDLSKHINIAAEAKADLSQIKKQIDLFKDGKCPTCGIESKCPECGYEFDTFNIEPLQEKIKELEETIKHNDFMCIQTKDILDKHKKALDEYNDKVKERNDLLKDIEDYEKERVDVKVIHEPEKIEYTEQTIESLETQKLQMDEDKKLFDIINEENTEFEKKKAILETEIKNLEENKKEYESIEEPDKADKPKDFNEEEYNELQKKLNVHEAQVAEKERIEKHNEKIHLEYLQTNKDIEDRTKEKESLYTQNKIKEDTKVLINKDFSAWLIEKGTEDVSYEMNKFFQRVHPDYQISIIQDKKSVDFFYTPDGQIQAPVSVASGLEKQLLAESFRLAISALQDLGILSLDEVDSDAAPEKAVQFYRNMIEYPDVEQFFIITHCQPVQEMLINEYGANEIKM
jgi:DNA repair exonuclease SbcCD ATPase subunit